MKSRQLLSQIGLFRPGATTSIPQVRCLHSSRMNIPRPIPRPIPLVPDVETFLRVIGRDLKQYADKFPSWDALFTLTSPQLKEIGVEPARSRRYLLQWLKRYREGKFGPGGDFKHVQDGKALLSIHHNLETDRKIVINVPTASTQSTPDLVRPRNYLVRGAKRICGPYATPLKPGMAQVTVVEGMWEDRLGQKVDGGERRQKEVRFKRRVAERKAAREEEGAAR